MCSSKARQAGRGTSRVLCVVATICLTFSWCLTLLAQQSSLSTLRGTVTDPAGAVVPNVTVTVTNMNTNTTRAPVVTNSAGDYEIPDLESGTYRLKATAAGFASFVANNIILASSEQRRIDIKLQLGSTTTSVTVKANAAVIQTESGQIQNSFNHERYYENPLPRIQLYPGLVMLTLPGEYNAHGGAEGPSGINGVTAGSAGIAECQDGICDTGPVIQDNDMNDVAEVQVFESNAPAEYSRPVDFDLVYKGGTDKYHGDLYGFLQNSAFDARDFFEPNKTRIIYALFGVHMGGPIKKNKLFFYGGWDRIRTPSETPESLTVPSSSMRNGDFSQLLSETHPVVIKDPTTGLSFPNNVVPNDRLSSTALGVQNLFIPSPNRGGTSNLVNNYFYVFPAPPDLYVLDYFNTRIDYAISRKNSLFWRTQWRVNPYYLPDTASPYPLLGYTRRRRHGQTVVSDTEILSPTVVNTARFGWNQDYVQDGTPTDGFTPLKGGDLISKLGLQGANSEGLNTAGGPFFNFSSITSIAPDIGGVDQDDNNYFIADGLTWAKGRHVIKFGGEERLFNDFSTFGLGGAPSSMYGSYTFDGTLTGYDYADFLLGLPHVSSRTNPIVNRSMSATEAGLFIEDTFKISSHLNLDYGLRWDYFGPAAFQDGKMYNWNPTTGNVIVPASQLSAVSPAYPSTINVSTGPVTINPYKRNLRPRLGFAYRFGEKTVIRGAYGQYTMPYNTGPLEQYSFAQGTGPFQIAENYNNIISNGAPLFQFPNAFPSTGGNAVVAAQSVTGYPLNLHNGVVHEFNVTVERQIGGNGIRVTYLGTRSRSLPYNLNINLPQPSLLPFTPSRNPYPQFLSASFLEQNGESNYDALQVDATRKLGGLTYDVNWTYANNMTNFANLQNPYNPNLWNHDDITSRHRLNLSASYELPVGRGRRFLPAAHGITQALLGGWKTTYIGFIATGTYFTPSFSGSDPSNTNIFGGLPNRICNGNYPSGMRTVNDWFNAACFTVPQPGTFGNSGVNILEGPGYNVHSVSLLKSWPLLNERMNVTFQAMAGDVFNNPTFLNPQANISAPGTVAHITSTVGVRDGESGENRRFQFVLTIRF